MFDEVAYSAAIVGGERFDCRTKISGCLEIPILRELMFVVSNPLDLIGEAMQTSG